MISYEQIISYTGLFDSHIETLKKLEQKILDTKHCHERALRKRLCEKYIVELIDKRHQTGLMINSVCLNILATKNQKVMDKTIELLNYLLFEEYELNRLINVLFYVSGISV